MVRMILTDLDQTILREDGSISEYTKEILGECRRRGILIGIATARVMVNSVRQRQLLGAELLICSNGSRILYQEDVLVGERMSADTVEALTGQMQKLPSMEEILMEGNDRVYANTRRFLPPHPYASAQYTDFAGGLREEAFQIFAGIRDGAEVERLKEGFPQCQCISYRNGRYAFLAKGISKHSALRKAAGKLQIPLEQIAAFGDDEGDIGMLKACGLGVAMGNGLEKVKEAAGYVTKGNEEDGVAWFLEHYVLAGCGF